MRWVFRALRLAVAVYLVVLAYLFFFQTSLIFYPPAAYTPVAEVAQRGFEAFDVKTEDGLTLRGLRKGARAKPFTIVYFHGNADTVANLVTGGVPEPFVAAGYGFVVPEYRGYSGNPGAPSEDGLYADARAFLRALIASGTPAPRIVLMAHSLGTGVATKMAQEFDVAGVILMAPFLSMGQMAQDLYPIFPANILTRHRFESADRIADLHAPLLIAHGEVDHIVNVSHGKTLFARATGNKTLRLYPSAGHNDLFAYGAAQDALAWLSKAGL